MIIKRKTPILIAASSLFITAWCATNAVGGITVTSIPLADGNTRNEARVIAPDGKWVAGFMGSGAMTYSSGVSAGFLYDVVTNTVYCPIIDSTPSSYAGTITGIGYRTESGHTEVLTSAGSSGLAQWYMTPDGGATWGSKFRDSTGATGKKPSVPAANGLAGSGSDIFYTTWTDQDPSGYQLRIGQHWGPWATLTTNWINKGIPNGQQANLNGVSGSGRGVGHRYLTGKLYKNNYVLDYNVPNGSGAGFNPLGLAGTTEGEIFCVSDNGNIIFGRSPIVTLGANLYGYKATFTGTKGTNDSTLASLTAMPNFADVPTNAAGLATPYGCTLDARYVAGMNYRGVEKAAIWDTGNANTNLWTISDLTDLALANGGADIFTRLSRAFSVGTNGAGDLVIAGAGTDGSVTRAFVMTLPKWVAAIQFPINQTVNYGANVTFSLKTNGTDSLSYQWYKDGSALSGATSTSLSYNNVTCAGGQAGTY